VVGALRESIYFVIGSDFINRKRAVENIKSKIVNARDSRLNTHTYYSSEIDIDSLRNLLFSFSLYGRNVLIFKEAQKLSPRIKDFLYNNVQKTISNNYFIFELEKDYGYLKQDVKFIKDKFFGFLLKKASLFKVGAPQYELFLKDLMKAIRSSRLADAICVLDNIFAAAGSRQGLLGMQILGALSRDSAYLANSEEKRKRFNFIWHTERQLKGGKTPPRLALELLIVRLFS